MPFDAEAMAASVVLAIKTALAPVQTKLLALHDKATGLEAGLVELNLLRDRLTAMETKAVPILTPERGEKGDPGEVGPIGPAGERGEPGLPGAIGEKGLDGAAGRDGIDGQIGPQGPQGERGEQGPPGLPGEPGAAGKDGEKGLDGKDGAPGLNGKDGRDGIDGKNGADGLNGKDGADGLNGKDVDMAEVAAVITNELASWPRPVDGRDGLPGVQGPQGLNGRDGSLEGNVKIAKVDDRTWQWCFKNGDPIEGGLMRFDGLELWRGIWVESKTYEYGDCVTRDGSEWHCNETTTQKPGDGTKAWTLKVKRGRDGKDGRDATTTTAPTVVRTR